MIEFRGGIYTFESEKEKTLLRKIGNWGMDTVYVEKMNEQIWSENGVKILKAVQGKFI